MKEINHVCLVLGVLLLTMTPVEANESSFVSKTDVSVRFDSRSNNQPRYQYRVRWYPQWLISDAWSLNAFAVTGDEFSSSYNTINHGQPDHFYLRRLFVRKQDGKTKTEVGVIPTYKGRVSSTGLSKDGWLTGIRHVQPIGKNNLFEIVIGDLSDVDSPGRFSAPHNLNYVEMEYSSNLDEAFSYEVGFERMLDANFLRAEIRYLLQDSELRFELIDRLGESRQKVIMAYSRELYFGQYALEFDFYYGYVDQGFGQRAELTEDFIQFGHSLSAEIGGELNRWDLEWFSKIEQFEGQSRFQLGLKSSF